METASSVVVNVYAYAAVLNNILLASFCNLRDGYL